MTTELNRIAEILRQENDFLVLSHANPDGDAIGSTLAMGWILDRLQKRYVLLNESGMPDRFSWLSAPAPLKERVLRPRYDRVLVLDCGAPDRAGDSFAPLLDGKKRVVNIDHHLGNPMFGGVNWVDPTMSSVGEMVGMLARELGLELTDGLGQAVYLALVSDTGSFSFSNTSPAVLGMAADILKHGLDVGGFNARLQQQSSLNRLRLRARVLDTARLDHDGRTASIVIDQAMFRETGTGPEDCEGLINAVRNIRGVDVAVSLREEGTDRIKFSLRSWGSTDVRAVAARFGGGGHRNAAGGAIKGSLAAAREQLVEAVGKMLADG
jgi:phosphoesterase RecJ-like protein